jgi:hypothetical protein
VAEPTLSGYAATAEATGADLAGRRRLPPPDGCRARELDLRFEVAVDHLALGPAKKLIGEAELDPAGLVQAGEVLGRELHVEAAEQVLELLGFADADDRDDPLAALPHPRGRHLRRGRVQLVGDPVDLAGDLEVAFGEARLVGGGASAVLRVLEEPRVYLPVRMPAAIGAQAVTDRPNASATGSSSRSAVRSSRLYSICSATKGLQPRSAASVLACDAIQAGASERAT